MAAESGTSYRGPARATGAEQTFDLKLIPEFDGSSQRVAEWLEKVELVCELCRVVDVARVLPLRLTGGAFAVYQQLPSEDRRKIEKVKAALLTAFALDKFLAYKQFTTRKLGSGESPNVFLAALERLAKLAGGVSESVLGCAFVAGLPDHVQDMLRAGARMEDLTLNQLVARARAIMAKESDNYETDMGLAARAPAAAPGVQDENSDIRCYACGGVNHFARECPTRQRTLAAGRGSQSRNVEPRVCNRGRGPRRVFMGQGNGMGEEAPAPASSRL
ncbi:hypothetical protein M513_07736 [Trichuris suis]|uniref:CCHC-type domain-containing protein n=1 Tax=Trichuris suis TaxID=68888 RepID=A0A085M285_9BILA|nr:hypothetical protein M513_07736 [Trichuris suis]